MLSALTEVRQNDVKYTCTEDTSPHPPAQQKNFRYFLLSLLIAPVLPFLRQEIADKYHLDYMHDPGNNTEFKQHVNTCIKHNLGKNKQLDHWIILQVS